jgi:hypothetical protein
VKDDWSEIPDWDRLKAAGAVGPLPEGLVERSKANLRSHIASEGTPGAADVLPLHAPSRALPRRRLVAATLLGSAAAVVLGAVGFVMLDHDPRDTVSSARATNDPGPPLSATDPSVAETTKAGPGDLTGGLCEEYSVDTLTERDFAFDGSVLSVEHGAKGQPFTSFKVNEWFAGGSGATVMVPMTPMQTQGRAETGTNRDLDGEERGPSYGADARLLVSGEFRSAKPGDLSDALVWSCGWSRYYDDATAVQWRTAFSLDKQRAE